MAYRRLPNTDNARLIAMVKLDECLLKNEGELIIYHKEVMKFKKKFTKLIAERKQLVMKRATLNKEKKELLISLKLYVSHFFQVLNFAIDRGDISKMCRTYFGLDVNTGIVPILSKEQDIITWAKHIVGGEKKRIENGIVAISHPNYKRVEELLLGAKNSFEELEILEKSFQNYHNEILIQRNQIDAFIKQIWNKIEHQFINESIEIKRKKSTQFGVVYVQ